MTRVADQLIETLKNEIHAGVLKPGDQLEEAALAQRFDVSRTPVREAVRSLVECGLLETRSRKGAFVRELAAEGFIPDHFSYLSENELLGVKWHYGTEWCQESPRQGRPTTYHGRILVLTCFVIWVSFMVAMILGMF